MSDIEHTHSFCAVHNDTDLISSHFVLLQKISKIFSFGHYGMKKPPLDRKSISYQQIIGLEHEK